MARVSPGGVAEPALAGICAASANRHMDVLVMGGFVSPARAPSRQGGVVDFAPFARDQMNRLGLAEHDVRRLVADAVIVIPLGGGKVMHEAFLGGRIVSVIVRSRPPATVVALTTRNL